jgi:hypothetical protein
MIGQDIVHVGIGDTGEGMIRSAFQDHLISTGRLTLINGDAHMTLEFARTLSSAPSFTFVRNPWDWAISFYLHQLHTRDWRGSFRDWFWFRDSKGVSFTDHFHKFTDPGVEYIGRFENYKQDFIRIVSAIIPHIVTEEELDSWFPSVYRQWCNRPWISGIEQHLRGELYDQKMIERVYKRDAEIIERFGYDFDHLYDFSDTHT